MNHAARIAVGTAVLTRRALGGTWKTVAIRGGAAAYVSPYLFAELQPYPYVAPAGLVGWLGAAWWAGRPHDPAKPTEPLAEQPPADAPVSAPVEVLTDAVRHLAAGGHGAHYEALAEYLTQATAQPWDTAAVRAAYRAAGIPHCGSVRQPGRGVSTGVRLADLPDPSPAAPPAPPVAVVAAGQDTATRAATATTTGPATADARTVEGVRMTLVDDPQNPSRTHVTVHP